MKTSIVTGPAAEFTVVRVADPVRTRTLGHVEVAPLSLAALTAAGGGLA